MFDAQNLRENRTNRALDRHDSTCAISKQILLQIKVVSHDKRLLWLRLIYSWYPTHFQAPRTLDRFHLPFKVVPFRLSILEYLLSFFVIHSMLPLFMFSTTVGVLWKSFVLKFEGGTSESNVGGNTKLQWMLDMPRAEEEVWWDYADLLDMQFVKFALLRIWSEARLDG